MQASMPKPRTDSSRPSAPADARIAELFAAFEAIWPRKWRVTEQSAQVWSFAVAKLDERAITAGIRHLIDAGEAWPPEPGAFANLCRDAQRRERADLAAASPAATPATPAPREAAWSAVAGTYALRMLGRPSKSRHDGPFDVNAFVDRHPPPVAQPVDQIAVQALFADLRSTFDAAWTMEVQS